MTEQREKAAAEPPLDCRVRQAVGSPTARNWAEAGKRIACAYCGRDRFSAPQPHKCNCGNIRKRHLRWLLLDEARNMPNDQGKPIAANEPNEGEKA